MGEQMEQQLDSVDKRLKMIRSKMSPKQRAEMAEVIAQELRNRQGAKMAQPKPAPSQVRTSRLSGSLSREELGEVYRSRHSSIAPEANSEKRIAPKRERSKERELKKVASPRRLEAIPRLFETFSLRQVVLAVALIALAIMKIVLASETGTANEMLSDGQAPVKDVVSYVEAEVESVTATPSPKSIAPVATNQAQALREASAKKNWSDLEVQLLTELDTRRVELERRKEALDTREGEVRGMEEALLERLAELRTLTRKLESARKERDQLYESRLEQLANVYGSMAPTEAAPLIAKLDQDIALGLLQRMPGKRMGQILSVMERERAVSLTKSLTERKTVQ